MGIFYKMGEALSGWLGRDNYKGFFQRNYSSRLGTKGAIYLDVEVPYKIFNEIPQINQVIRKKSSMFANMVLKLVDKEGNQVDNPKLYTLLENPNPLQSQNEFLRLYMEQKDVYGNQFMYKSVAGRIQEIPTALNHLSPKYCKPILTGKVYDQVDMSGIVERYELTQEVKGIKRFDTSNVLWSRVTDLDDPLVGVSPIRSLIYPVSNTKLAYDYLNVISGEKGAIGILSNQGKDSMGSIPMDPEEKKKIETAYRNDYGIGEDKMKVIITSSSLAWTPMSYPTKDLMLLEQIDAYFLTVVDHFGLNVNIFSSKNQTYENVKNAIKQCYQDTIFVEADQFTQALTKFLNIPEGQRIIADYSHLQILQSDTTSQAQTLSTATSALTQLVTAKIIDQGQAQDILTNTFGINLG